MTTETLQQLIQHPEGTAIGFQRDLNVQVVDLITAIFTLANDAVGTGQDAYLVIGVDNGQVYDVGDVDTHHLTHILSQLTSANPSAFPEVRWESVTFEGSRLFLLTIPPVPQKIEYHISADSSVHFDKVRDISGVVAGHDATQNIYNIHIHMAAAEEKAPIPAYERAMTYNFDLVDQVRPCVKSLREQRSLIGFAVPYCSPDFLKNFSGSLERKLRRKKVLVQEMIEINPTYAPVDFALKNIINKRYIPMLELGDVLFLVKFSTESAAPLFWQQLHGQFNGHFKHRLFTIMALSSDLDFPPEVTKLSRPLFEVDDLDDWIDDVVKSFRWPEEKSEEVLEEWVNIIQEDCADDKGVLNIELVYLYLETSIQILNQQPPPGPEQFLQEFNTRR